MVYLFVGEDEIAKAQKLKELKRKYLNPASLEFNYDLLYGKETSLAGLQEILSRISANSPKRMVVIKEADKLSPPARDFLTGFAKKARADIILVLDFPHPQAKAGFLKQISFSAQILQFAQRPPANTFKLCDELERKRIAPALKILQQLLREGEKPERILGGLRWCWERDYSLTPREKARRLRLLLNCDTDIKSGRLRPDFSLEKMLVTLCFFDKTNTQELRANRRE